MTVKQPPVRSEPNIHKQKRGVLTRKQLLRSARAIFARDGFEHARLEDIALKAGKTRGAFYDHFKDKEDVFFAIFEENIELDAAELSPLLLSLPTLELRVEALVEYLSQLTKHRERVLLNLEFKLYAIRHPHRQKRLAALHGNMRLQGSVPELNRLLAQLMDLPDGKLIFGSSMICSVYEGLALNHLFDPDTFDSPELARYLKLCLQESMAASPSTAIERKPKGVPSQDASTLHTRSQVKLAPKKIGRRAVRLDPIAPQ